MSQYQQPSTDICPLMLIGSSSYDSPARCIEQRCAWWNYPGCVLSGIVEELGNIAVSLDDIAQAMKKTTLDATNIQSGEVDTSDQTVSVSDDSTC